MAPVIVDPSRIKEFATETAFESWLAKHHDEEHELWIRIYKKGSGVRSVTPAGAKSIWSDIKRENVARLLQAKRMTPHGLRHVEAAKADGRWTAAYKGPRTMTVPDDLMRAIEADRKALATYQKLDKRTRWVLSFRLGNLRTAAGRAKRIATYVQMLRRGETILPSKSPARRERRGGQRIKGTKSA